jgi:hypothetical protein
MTIRNTGITKWILVLALAACTQPRTDEGPVHAIRDSAGIQIVENREPLWTDSTQWRVAERPSLQIGESADGRAEQQFANIMGVHRLANGQIAVLDSWALAVVFFDSSGVLLGRVGRAGKGPGEFPERERLSLFSCGADTVYVAMQLRVSAFTPPNRHVRTFSLDRPARMRACVAGRFVGELRPSWRRSTGVFTDSLVLAAFGLNGTMGAVIDTLPAEENDWIKSGEGFGYSRAVFGRVLSIAGRGTTLATGFGDGFHVEVRDTAGAVTRIVRIADLDRTAGAAEIDRFRSFVFNPWRGNSAERTHLESRLEAARDRPLPAFAELRLDAGGNIWARLYDHLDAVAFYDYSSLIRQFQRPSFDDARRWIVIRADGRYLGEVSTPPRFTVHEIGEDWIIGVWRDELDIPFVRRYALIKPTA